MESEHFVIVGERRINRRHCAIQVRNAHGDLFEVPCPWTGTSHYADMFMLEGNLELQKELTDLIEAYTS